MLVGDAPLIVAADDRVGVIVCELVAVAKAVRDEDPVLHDDGDAIPLDEGLSVPSVGDVERVGDAENDPETVAVIDDEKHAEAVAHDECEGDSDPVPLTELLVTTVRDADAE